MSPIAVRRRPLRVLVVDDDEYVREVIGMILEGVGHSVTTTPSGAEALRWLGERLPDLMVIDLRMPEIDGPALYREILERWPTGSPRALFVSGQAEMTGYEDVLGTLNVPVLVKPFTLEELSEAVNRVLETA